MSRQRLRRHAILRAKQLRTADARNFRKATGGPAVRPHWRAYL